MARKIELILEGRDAGAAAAVDGVQDALGDLESDLSTMATVAAGAFAALAGGAVLAGKAAIDAERPWVDLEQQLRNARVEFTAVEPEIRKTALSLQNMAGIGDEETAAALGTLVDMTGNYSASLARMNNVADLAVAKFRGDMVQAAEVYGRVMSGNTGILQRYGIVVKEGTDATDQLARIFAGRAASAGNTWGAQLQGMREDFGDLLEVIGEVILGGSDFTAMLKNARAEIQSAQEWVSSNRDQLEQYVKTLKDAVVWVVNVAKATADWVVANRDLLTSLAQAAAIALVVKHAVSLSLALQAATAAAGGLTAALTAALPVLGPAGMIALGVGAIAFALLRMRDAATEANGAMTKLGSSPGALLLQVEGKDAELRDAETRRRNARHEVEAAMIDKEIWQLRAERQALRSLYMKSLQPGSASLPPFVPPAGPGKQLLKDGFSLLGVGGLPDPRNPLNDPGLAVAALLGRGKDNSLNARAAGIIGGLPPAFLTDIKIGGSEAMTALQALNETQDQTIAKALELQRTVDQAITQGLVGVFKSFASSLEQIFTGDIADAFAGLANSILGLLGDMMISAGTSIVLTSQAFEAFKLSLTALLPGGGIGAGIALIAAGAAFKAGAGAFLANPTGGGGGGGSPFTATGADFGNGLRGVRDQGMINLYLEGDVLDFSSPQREDKLAAAIERISGKQVNIFRGAKPAWA